MLKQLKHSGEEVAEVGTDEVSCVLVVEIVSFGLVTAVVDLRAVGAASEGLVVVLGMRQDVLRQQDRTSDLTRLGDCASRIALGALGTEAGNGDDCRELKLLSFDAVSMNKPLEFWVDIHLCWILNWFIHYSIQKILNFVRGMDQRSIGQLRKLRDLGKESHWLVV